MRIFKEIVLCGAIAATSYVVFIILGTFYVASEHNTLINILVWVSEGLVCYLAFIFIPWFNKRKVYYLDGFALASAYLIIVLICLARQYSFNEYLYLDALVFISSGVAVFEIVLRLSRMGKHKKLVNNIPNEITDKINLLEIWEQKPIKDVVIYLMNNDCVSIKEAAIVTEIGERKTRNALNDAVTAKILETSGKTNNKRYKLIK